MPLFSDELDTEEIYFRDNWQFEQKSDFIPDSNATRADYTQEIYFFIPNSLQVNSSWYKAEDFFRDEVNLIRFKTPVFTLKEINDQITEGKIELKLLGNVVRSSIRTACQKLSHLLDQGKYDLVTEGGNELLRNLDQFLERFRSLKGKVPNGETYDYVDTYLHQCMRQYLLVLLEKIRQKNLTEIDDRMTNFLLEKIKPAPNFQELSDQAGEEIVYQKALLNKFVLDALLLQINRFSPKQKYQHLIASVAAGVAMFFFFVLFVKQREWFILNSTPFILFTVFIYVIKDRIKEWVREASSHQRLGWLSDFTTQIRSPDGKKLLGVLKEKFSYLEQGELPKEVREIRNREFHSYIESFVRPETILYYKKNISIYKKPAEIDLRRFIFNIFSRFSIRHFVEKASNPYTTYLYLNPKTKQIQTKQLAKVYHINIIIITKSHGPEEIQKVRLIADKNGIKRVEYLP